MMNLGFKAVLPGTIAEIAGNITAATDPVNGVKLMVHERENL